MTTKNLEIFHQRGHPSIEIDLYTRSDDGREEIWLSQTDKDSEETQIIELSVDSLVEFAQRLLRVRDFLRPLATPMGLKQHTVHLGAKTLGR